MPFRPIIPKARETLQAIVTYQSESHQNPPYHTDAPFQKTHVTNDITIASYTEIHVEQPYRLKSKVWNATINKKSYDTIPDPFGN